ncbi:MAG TPA: two-component regulator propeller domain-containing protein, partial [bacterium]|nr:two-component regulator propeller domain-containing protein [bacterium]
MIRRFFIGTVLFWLSALHAQQNITFETLSIEQGLSQTVVYSIVQDSRGFLWFGTQDGLNRYDGYNFTVYKNNHLDTASLSDNRILKVFKDRSGLLWIGTADGGLCRFDRDKESFVI